jgi:hypothetical protein
MLPNGIAAYPIKKFYTWRAFGRLTCVNIEVAHFKH